MNHKIAIVNSSSFGKIFPDQISRLEKLGEVKRFEVPGNIEGKELAEILHGYDMIIASVTPTFGKEFFKYKDKTILISRHGIGYDTIDVIAAKENDTIVSIVPALVERNAVAELNVTNLLNIMRKVNQSYQAVLSDKWENRSQFVGNGLTNKRVGVLGIGNTGSKIVEMLRYGFQCEVLGYDPNKSKMELEQFGARKVNLDELLEQSEVICLAACLNEDNMHMISTKEFMKMRDNVYISNAARGALIDESAMVSALESGKVAGFATDVLEEEPGRANHPYLQFDNVLMTSHIAAYTKECLEDMGNKCVNDCMDVAAGKLPVRSVQSKSKFIKEVVL